MPENDQVHVHMQVRDDVTGQLRPALPGEIGEGVCTPRCICRNFEYKTWPRWTCNKCLQDVVVGVFGSQALKVFVRHLGLKECVALKVREDRWTRLGF